MVHDHLLDPEHLNRFKTLILPNIAALSTQQCSQLRAFVAQGGSLVATYETSLYDEWGVRRKDFGLADLFGTSFTAEQPGPLLNSYLSLNRAAAHAQALLIGLEDTPRIINGARGLSVTPLEASASSPLMLVPPYPDLPMEEVFTPPVTSHQPGVLLREVGQGRVVYFPADIDRTFWEVLDLDQSKLLRNAVLWATNEPAPVTVEGPGVLDLSVWSQKRSMTVHLVNLTNPMMMKGPLREVIPITAQQLTIRIPEGRRVAQVRLLVAGNTVPHHAEASMIKLTVPSIAIHEVVAVDFAT